MYHCTVHGPRPVAKSAKVVEVDVGGTSVAQPTTTIKHAAISFDIDRQTSVGERTCLSNPFSQCAGMSGDDPRRRRYWRARRARVVAKKSNETKSLRPTIAKIIAQMNRK